jgi:putative acetyltransferase
MSNTIIIREIKEQDNFLIGKIIRDTLTEFGANRPGTVFTEATTDRLYEVFQKENSVYFVAEINHQVVGGGGIYPTEGLPMDTCELVKMYLLKEARGLGLGTQLINNCLQAAKNCNFKTIYLETMPELQNALKVYEKFGFQYLKEPMGNSGHFGCSLWMNKSL